MYPRYLCSDTCYQLFFINGSLVVLLYFSVCDILQPYSPSRVADGNNSAFFPVVWNWSLAATTLYVCSYCSRSHLWFHFVSLSNQKMKSLAQRRQSAPSLIFVKALNRSRSVSRWVSEFCCLYCFAVSQPKTWIVHELLSAPGCQPQIRLVRSCTTIKSAERCGRPSPDTSWSPRWGFPRAATLSCLYPIGQAELLPSLQPDMKHWGCSF